MGVPLKLAIDRQKRSLAPYLGRVTAMPSLFQSNSQRFEIVIVEPTGSIQTPYADIDCTGLSLRISVGETPTGTAGGPTVKAFQILTWDADEECFIGDLALNTAAIDSYLGALSEKSGTYFEANLVEGSDRSTILQTTFTLKAVVDEGSSTVPTPTDQYPTLVEADARYAQKSMPAGEVLQITSSLGTYTRILGVDEGGNRIDEVITN